MTPNLRYINQSAPFWDWIASFEQSAADHPFFGGQAQHAPGQDRAAGSHPPHPPHYSAPWAAPWAQAAWNAGPWGRPGWHGGPGAELPHRGGPPPHYHDHHHHNQQESGEEISADEKIKDGVEGETSKEAKEGAAPDPPEDTPQGWSERDARRWARQTRKCERRDRKYGPGSRGHHGGPGHHGGRGGWGGRGGFGGFGMLRDLFGNATEANADGSSDWKPEADVFDTESGYVVHVSLPGAQKEDIGVTWDAEKSELSVAGVVHRPGDEAFIKTLALDERKTGAFERKVRLGTRAVPAHVDVEGINAKLENGILIVEVPKLNGEFVEVKKVDIA